MADEYGDLDVSQLAKQLAQARQQPLQFRPPPRLPALQAPVQPALQTAAGAESAARQNFETPDIAQVAKDFVQPDPNLRGQGSVKANTFTEVEPTITEEKKSTPVPDKMEEQPAAVPSPAGVEGKGISDIMKPIPPKGNKGLFGISGWDWLSLLPGKAGELFAAKAESERANQPVLNIGGKEYSRRELEGLKGFGPLAPYLIGGGGEVTPEQANEIIKKELAVPGTNLASARAAPSTKFPGKVNIVRTYKEGGTGEKPPQKIEEASYELYGKPFTRLTPDEQKKAQARAKGEEEGLPSVQKEEGISSKDPRVVQEWVNKQPDKETYTIKSEALPKGTGRLYFADKKEKSNYEDFVENYMNKNKGSTRGDAALSYIQKTKVEIPIHVEREKTRGKEEVRQEIQEKLVSPAMVKQYYEYVKGTGKPTQELRGLFRMEYAYAKLMREATAMAEKEGFTGYSRAEAEAKFKAKEAAANKLETLQDTNKAFEKMLRGQIDIMTRESAKFDRTQLTTVNNAILKMDRSLLSDPQAIKFYDAVMLVVRDYGLMMGSFGLNRSQVTNEQLRLAESMVNSGWSHKALMGVADLIKEETGVRIGGVEEETEEVYASLGGRRPTPREKTGAKKPGEMSDAELLGAGIKKQRNKATGEFRYIGSDGKEIK